LDFLDDQRQAQSFLKRENPAPWALLRRVSAAAS